MTERKRFFIQGQEQNGEAYHYRASGLDNVYLLNGFERKETDYGAGVTIRNVERLHRAIGAELVVQDRALSPREFRFLRKQMGLTQQQLADRLEIDIQTVARYEKDQTAIPGPTDNMVRALYALSLLSKEDRAELLEELKERIERDKKSTDPSVQPMRFRQTGCSWESQVRH